MPDAINRRRTETAIAALVAIAAAIVGIVGRDHNVLSPKYVAMQRIGRFVKPVYLAQPPGSDSQLFVVEKPGRIVALTNDRVQPRPFLDIHKLVKSNGKGDEQGLLSMAFPPNYKDSHLFYVAYTDHRNALRVVQYRRSAESQLVADPGTARQILRIPEPTTKHHGGLVLFGPDGDLYIGSGDGGPSGDPGNVAQNKRLLLGKILRIDPITSPGTGTQAAYTVPRDNPFVGKPGRDEIWAYGLRNPWRFTFDRPSDTIAIGDVGNDRYEEVDLLPADKARGANFGWSAYEGNAPLKADIPRNRTVLPTLAYPHGPGCAITGGYIVRDPRLAHIRGRKLVGRYLYGDYCSGKLFAFRIRPDGKAGKRRSFRFKVPYLTSFAEDNAHRIYLMTERGKTVHGRTTRGSLYRLVPNRKEVPG
jgi:glucose/arabinose dehydrogenase